jgi:hypothetical protein
VHPVREAHENVHDGAAHVVEVVPRAADGVLEKRVACEAGLAVHDEREAAGGVARRAQRLDAKVAGLDDVPVGERLRTVDGLGLIRQHRGAETTLDLAVVRNVVRVAVRRQKVRDLYIEPLGSLNQRRQGSPAIHEEARPARLVGDEVGIGEPRGIHAPFDDHAEGRMPTRPIPGGTDGSDEPHLERHPRVVLEAT